LCKEKKYFFKITFAIERKNPTFAIAFEKGWIFIV